MKISDITKAAAAIIIVALLAGCGGGGSKSQGMTSPWNGTLRGVATLPENNDTGVPTDAWIQVSWPDERYPPPASFTVTLEKEESYERWGRVHTIYSKSDSDPRGGVWWFQPSNQLSPGIRYRITISIPKTSQLIRAYFFTGGYGHVGELQKSLAAPSTYKPVGATKAEGEPAESHTIITTD